MRAPSSSGSITLMTPPVGGDFRKPPSPYDTAMNLRPLGDQAILAYLPDEAAAVRFAAAVRAAGFGWLQDVVPAYASVGVFFDADRANLTQVIEALQALKVP